MKIKPVRIGTEKWQGSRFIEGRLYPVIRKDGFNVCIRDEKGRPTWLSPHTLGRPSDHLALDGVGAVGKFELVNDAPVGFEAEW